VLDWHFIANLHKESKKCRCKKEINKKKCNLNKEEENLGFIYYYYIIKGTIRKLGPFFFNTVSPKTTQLKIIPYRICIYSVSAYAYIYSSFSISYWNIGLDINFYFNSCNYN
jgi:hypothetical protein